MWPAVSKCLDSTGLTEKLQIHLSSVSNKLLYISKLGKICSMTAGFQESDDLKRKQVWYQQNQVSLQKEDEREYLAYCCETTFRIRVLEARLQRYTTIMSSVSNLFVLISKNVLFIFV